MRPDGLPGSSVHSSPRGSAEASVEGEVDDSLDNTSVAESPLVKLTKLMPVPVTSVWPTEPHHFTPWLLDNSEELSEILGLDIELEEREHKVGKYSLDLIGRELATDRPVIVENQFGPTDHTHLGQLLTYAGGTRPSTIIWIAEDFREEHRAALDWLNDVTHEGVRFFGIRLSAVTLGGAPSGLVAPFLELVVQPNYYVKGASVAASTATSATAQFYAEFWGTVAPLLKERGWSNGKGTTQNWWPMTAACRGSRGRSHMPCSDAGQRSTSDIPTRRSTSHAGRSSPTDARTSRQPSATVSFSLTSFRTTRAVESRRDFWGRRSVIERVGARCGTG